MALSREEKIAEATKLRGRGLTNVEIARGLGVHPSTVHGWLRSVARPGRVCIACHKPFQPEHGNQLCCSDGCRSKNDVARKRRCAEQARALCTNCEKPLMAGSRWRGYELCQECWRSTEAKRIEARARIIERLWRDGLSRKEIGRQIGWTENHVNAEINALRAKGYDLPYRYKPGKKNATKFPEQVAA